VARDLVGDPDTKQWMEVARADSARPEQSSITVDPIYGRAASTEVRAGPGHHLHHPLTIKREHGVRKASVKPGP
jgi:hypothetical protein